MRVRGPKRLNLPVTERLAHECALTDKRRIADDEFRWGPVRPPRIGISLLTIDDLGKGFSVPLQYRVLHLNVLERLQDRLFWRRPLCSEMPLQIADPQHQFGDCGRAGINLKPQ